MLGNEDFCCCNIFDVKSKLTLMLGVGDSGVSRRSKERLPLDSEEGPLRTGVNQDQLVITLHIVKRKGDLWPSLPNWEEPLFSRVHFVLRRGSALWWIFQEPDLALVMEAICMEKKNLSCLDGHSGLTTGGCLENTPFYGDLAGECACALG